ncbi:hypothetical protein NC797_14400 [Aquibacillus sp. 3ASR75-11]|uniref:Beta-lactamase inhibitor (BLIP) n=1 Tax=Terrihalobacillus insolitus TaxID=2950438 RepID=A0A9X4APM6_9BACI|nr:hypothetical protein [Terrihalobacillus insolitus]MDC3413251.1 hypothetical protein [Terrihalobacillus insolitus]MDC3425695.1 hypothetical protein [Terrihalobacillus insolitus]
MKRRFYLFLMVFVITNLLVGCNNPKSLEDTFTSEHTNNDIIKVLKFNDETEAVILYTLNKDNKVSAAEYRQVNNKWKGSSDISENNAGKLSFGFTHQGEKNEEVLFGKINDPNIEKVQVEKLSGEVLKATIVNHNGTSYWYLVWTYGTSNLIGLNKDGQRIYNAEFK